MLRRSLLACGLILAASSANATTVTVLFTGVVDSLGSNPSTPVGVGTTWTALLTIDPDTPEDPFWVGNSAFGVYPGAVTAASFSIGTGSGGSSLYLEIHDDVNNFSDGFYMYGGSVGGGLLSGNLAGEPLNEVRLELIDLDLATFDSDAIQVPTEPGAAQNTIFSMSFGRCCGGPLEGPVHSITGHVTSIEIVPEPSILGLLGAAAAGAVLRRRN